MVPDQNGRTPEFSSPVTLDSEVRFPFLLAFELLLGSVFSFLQSGNALSEYAIERRRLALRLDRRETRGMAFAARYLTESRNPADHVVTDEPRKSSRQAIWRVMSNSSEPSSRLIWIYAIAIGAFQGSFSVLALFLNARFQVTEQTIGYFFMYVGSISVFTRVLLLGRMVDWLGEARLSRLGLILLAAGVLGMPLARNLWMLAIAVALIPLGTAFTFPCVTALLSRVIVPRERGLYMEKTTLKIL